jgi:hypothetical protein
MSAKDGIRSCLAGGLFNLRRRCTLPSGDYVYHSELSSLIRQSVEIIVK